MKYSDPNVEIISQTNSGGKKKQNDSKNESEE